MVDYFFSFTGRIPRKHYWIASLAVIAAIIVAAAIGFALMEYGLGTVTAFALPGVIIAIAVVSSFSIGLRRLHDRNKSWIWLIPFYILPAVLDPQWFGFSTTSTLYWVMTVVSFGLSIWALLELGILKGTDGQNTYGDNPLNPMPNADVFQ